MEFRHFIEERKILMVRNFATTAALLDSDWALTPYEIVSEIRYQASIPFREGAAWQLIDDNGTHLEGIIKPALGPSHPWFPAYTTRREEAGHYRPWPEWVIPPINLDNTSGILVFDRMLSWWSRYIGISPYFSRPIWLTVKNGRIIKIEGADEAEALSRFLIAMEQRLGEGVYQFNTMHFGVHPQALIGPEECPHLLTHRLIEHSHTSNIHFHIGAPPATLSYPYWMHCTGDIRTATLCVGDTLLHDKGRLTVLDHPSVIALAAKYPGRPGLPKC